MRKMTRAALFAGGVWLAAMGGALAQTPPAVTPPPAATQASPIGEQERRDAAIVQNAFNAVARGGYSALAPLLPQLNEVASHAPASYPRLDLSGETSFVRSLGGPQSAADLVLGAAMAQAAGKKGNVLLVFNTYGGVFLLRGAYAVDARAPEAALEVLDKGLAMQPDNADLITEKGSALQLLRRWSEMLAMYNEALARNWPLVTAEQKARMLRGKGFALTELGRLDESEAAYRESLAATPGNAVALNELQYLARLRAGGSSVPGQVFVPTPTQPLGPDGPTVSPAQPKAPAGWCARTAGWLHLPPEPRQDPAAAAVVTDGPGGGSV